jgi:hypothetical protein
MCCATPRNCKHNLRCLALGLQNPFKEQWDNTYRCTPTPLPQPQPFPDTNCTVTFPGNKWQVRNQLKAEWEVEKVARLLCTNNPAERPFAVAKAYMQIYGRLNPSTLAQFTLSVCNGSHSIAGPKGKIQKPKIESRTKLASLKPVTQLCSGP